MTEKIVAITQGRSYLRRGDQAAQARAVPVEVRHAHAVRHRPGHARDDGDGAARVRHAAHPVRGGRLRRHQGVRTQGRLLPHRGRQGPRDRRPDERHDPALQQGRRARPGATARGRAAPQGAARRRARRSPSSTSTTWAATSSARRSTRPARSAWSRSSRTTRSARATSRRRWASSARLLARSRAAARSTLHAAASRAAEHAGSCQNPIASR